MSKFAVERTRKLLGVTDLQVTQPVLTWILRPLLRFRPGRATVSAAEAIPTCRLLRAAFTGAISSY